MDVIQDALDQGALHLPMTLSILIPPWVEN